VRVAESSAPRGCFLIVESAPIPCLPPTFVSVSCLPPTPQDDLVFLRVRTKKHEVMVAPDKDYLLIVVQDPNAEDHKA
jgi:hypothetical protein